MRLIASTVTVMVVAVASFAGSASAARTTTVSLKDVRFMPKTAQVKRGERVRWRWNDGATPHNVTSRGTRSFKSSSTKTRGEHVARFTKAGSYRYVCTIHPGMDGRVIVR